MRAYKFTGPGAAGMFTCFAWPKPSGGVPGAWVLAPDDVEVCVGGVHACRVAQVPYWLAAELWEIELAGAIVESTFKIVAPAGRLVARVDGWPSVERGFARGCATRTRDLAVSALRRGGFCDDADAVMAAATTDELGVVAEAVAPRVAPLVATLTGYAFDCARDVDRGYYAMCAYVAATAFADHSTGAAAQDMSAGGWVDERARQARWLADRLELRSGD